MTNQHPITPPPELRKQWIDDCPGGPNSIAWLATKAARWGADQELEACCEWLETAVASPSWIIDLRAARRPKPPSLKEQALNGLQRIEANIPQSLKDFESSCEVIRRAIEALPND
jgi:hypothetical protein